MSIMKFRSLSVLDFIEESESWKTKEEFVDNLSSHKEELKKIDVVNEEAPYFGCKNEIDHLIDFSKKILFYMEYGTTPAGITNDDFDRVKSILSRYCN